MKKITFLIAILFSFRATAGENCFIAKEAGKITKQIGKCDAQHSPYSTFKIAIAVMGFDGKILENAQSPRFEIPQEGLDKRFFNPQKYPIQAFYERPQTPESWMKYSVVWYSQEITKKLGLQKFRQYILKFNYGNMDAEKNDALQSAWLGDSLKIFPIEQVEFIEKLSEKKLPVSKKAQENTIKIIALEDIFDDWKLYGKTGGSMNSGWFVGFVEKNNRRIIFAQYVEPKNSLISAGRIAKELAKDNLISLVL